VAQLAGYDHIITFDMGGTSTDVALCPGKLPTTAVGEIADLPLRLPIIDIHTVGAGGGSLAHVDAGGALHVGPQSAGADPGPACYGRGTGRGRLQATTTDANLVLGRLDADHFLGGTMKLDVAAAQESLSELAVQMGASSPETAAWGVIQVANANMERAIRRISVERGFGPRRFTLVPFGGAGPLHACEMAADLQIPRVLIPAIPGVLSALGMLVAAPTKDYSRTVMAKSGEWQVASGEWLAAQFAPLEERALAEMAAEGHDAESLNLHRSLDMRYVGQSHELTITLSPAPLPPLSALLHAAHEVRYGYQQPHAEVEIVNVRLTAVAPITPPQLPQQPVTTTEASTALIGKKTVWFNQQPMPTKLDERAKLQPGHRFVGPAIVFQYDTTTVIPPEWETAVDVFGNLSLTYQRLGE
jgi:N-methylhydantoinase A